MNDYNFDLAFYEKMKKRLAGAFDELSGATKPVVTAIQKPARLNWMEQRAENLSILGCRQVIELLVGQNMESLGLIYKKHRITCYGNDINGDIAARFSNFRVYTGDALEQANAFIGRQVCDTLVFNPPMKRKSGAIKPIDWIRPSYYDFLAVLENHPKMRERVVITLPARCLTSAEDKKQYFKLIAKLPRPFEAVNVSDKTHKYVEIYMEGVPPNFKKKSDFWL